jgi:hypothetical protein
MHPKAIESATVRGSVEHSQFPGALFSSNQIASFAYSDDRVSFSTKVSDCVVRALDAIGSSATMQQVIFWNLSEIQKVGPGEVADKPTEFMEGIRAIFGEAGADVFEFMLIRQIKREFGLAGTRSRERKSLAEVLQFVGLEL